MCRLGASSFGKGTVVLRNASFLSSITAVPIASSWCCCHTLTAHKTSLLFPNKITTKQQSVALVKRLLAISVSCITYLRGLFPESSYGTRYLDDLCLKILREDKSCLGSETKTRLC
uniref:HORMA domain-containing protein n=1 Tax=Coturnix japonica TaxID=93934 RepID=A0A8C2TY25_COTJA